MTAYLAELAWLGGGATGPVRDVLIEVDAGRFSAVTPRAGDVPAGVTRLAGLTMPGLANAHSHAFHRALRGRTHAGKGTFWTWRRAMYEVATRLDPDSYAALARAAYAEMALAGVACVGEFHYLHHGPGGHRYADPNAMSHALLWAAAEAGVRITLLDTVYLTSSVDGKPPDGPQLRFSDGDLDAWSERRAALAVPPGALAGAAVHSVRAVPAEVLPAFAGRTDGVPVHVHVSEQRAENEACRARHGCSPTELLHASGLLGPHATAVHATHLNDLDRTLLGDTDTAVCFCPTTERDLADGIGPARALVDAGSPLCLGSDSQAVVVLFEEARAVELNERLRTERRGHFSAAELLHAATAAGHTALGWADAGTIAPGARADLVTVRLDTVRTAGAGAADAVAAVVFGATAADVWHVVVDGRVVVQEGRHSTVPDVAGALRDAVAAVTR
ncbi:MAG TPA: formimidoylglutamate deiminase [Micromonosporaceae bacterium]|nr:formimidoylglutamate deiminase [Micromonosporaceae bacterium]